MSGNDLFGDKPVAEVTGIEALAALVGDGKKYATVEDLAKGAVNGQAHITKLEGEAVVLNDGATKAKSVDDILAALKAQQVPDGNLTPAHQPEGDTLTTEQIVAAALAQRDEGHAKTKAEANVALVMDKLVAKFGDKAGEHYSRIGKELGISLDALAEKSPDAVIKLVSDGQQLDSSSHLPAGNPGAIDPNGDVLNQANINKMYKEGKIKLAQKHELENQQIDALGVTAFYNRTT